MSAQKVKWLIAVLLAMVLLIGAGVAYAANSAVDTGTGGGAQQVAGEDDDSDGAGEEAEEPGDADEPGDSDGPGDTED